MLKALKTVLPLMAIGAIASCQTAGTGSKMGFEEARDVVLSMQSIPLEPPPRKITDILALLENGEDAGSDHFKDLKRRADMVASDKPPAKDLYLFYKSRGYARYELNRFNECHEDIRRAIAYSQQAQNDDATLYQKMAELEMLAGRYENALALSRTAMKAINASGWRVGPFLAFQSLVYHRMGNFRRADQTLRSAKEAYRKVPDWARLSLVLYSGTLDMGTQVDIQAVEAEMLEARGRYIQAHELRSLVLNDQYRKRELKPLGSVYAQMAIAINRMHQGRLILAEKTAREAVTDALRISGKQSSITAEAIQVLGRIMLAKGDLSNADKLSKIQIDILKAVRLAPDEALMVRGCLFRATVLNANYEFAPAMESYDSALGGMTHNPYLYKRYVHRNFGLILCMIKNDRISEAEELIQQTRGSYGLLMGIDADDETEILALEALVLHSKNQTAAALAGFSEVVPALSALAQDTESPFERRRRAEILLQFYVDTLLDLYLKHRQNTFGIDVAETIFHLMDTQYSQVGCALGESSARAASLTDPELAELVRQEQDAAKQLESLKAVYYNAAAASGDAQNESLMSLEKSIQALEAALLVIKDRIATEFPRYADYIHPKPPKMAHIQAQLTPKEAFIAIWTLVDKTCVWAIPYQGEPSFAVIEVGEQAMKERVSRLRKALKPKTKWLSEIPEFDLDTAYALYNLLLRPVEPTWQNARDLLVVIKGPCDQIPLALLPTAPIRLNHQSAIRFEAYQEVPWLIRKTSITRLPSAASLLTLRALPAGNPERGPFVGFGDPIFKAAGESKPEHDPSHMAQRGIGSGDIEIRGIRLSELGQLDSQSITSVHIEHLSRLPDTAREIKDIAATMGADPATDIYLGKAASENRVKTMNLARKRILAIATHALLPGDLDGLTQPALAFSSPQVTGEDEDGLLTAGEILTLKLDADLVVLSACDTGAGGGSGNEAVSGIGRAFFYSGARALLVTMWTVETTSANKLTTGIFRFREKDKTLSWARAHQKSVLQLLQDPGLKAADGRIAARYAHPLFWAPFLVVGDSGAHRSAPQN